jgi:hypothetical protein
MAGNIVPRSDTVGTLGTATKRWNKGFFSAGVGDGTDTLKPVSTTATTFKLNVGGAAANALIAVARGAGTDVSLRWNNADSQWEFTNDGTIFKPIAAATDAFKVKNDATDPAGGYLGGKIDTNTMTSNETLHVIGVKSNVFVTITGTESVSGVKTFTSGILVGSITEAVASAGITFNNTILMTGKKITGLGTPTVTGDAATKDYVDSKIQGIDWQESVLDAFNNDPPLTPSTGDRYIVGPIPTGDWVAHPQDIAQYTGTVWAFTVKNLGMATYVEDVGTQYLWNGTAWVVFGSTTAHNSTSGLQGGQALEYYHLTHADYDNLIEGHPDFTTSVTAPTVYTDTISEKTSTAGVTIDGIKLKDSEFYTDSIVEKTAATGVTIDGVLLKDSAVTTDTINEKTASAGVTIDSVVMKDGGVSASGTIKADTVTEYTLDNGISVEGVTLKDGSLSGANLTATTAVLADTINERTATSGVTIETVLVKDGSVTVGASGFVSTDTVSEKTSTAGVTVDSVLLKDGSVTVGTSGFVSTDTVSEKTSAAGVTVDGVLLKDSQVTTDQINEKTATAGVTIDGVLLKDLGVGADTVNEKTSNAGVTVEGVLIKDSIIYAGTIDEAVATEGVVIDGLLVKDHGIDGSGAITIDTINEHTADAGVTIEGVHAEDNSLDMAGYVLVDTINEYTSAAGVTVEGVLLKDNNVTVGASGAVYTDTITEKTSAAGITADSVLLKDGSVTVGSGGSITTDTVYEKTSGTGVTIDSLLIKDGGLDGAGSVLIDTINEHTSAAGVTIDSVILKDGCVTVGTNGTLTADTLIAKASSSYKVSFDDTNKRWLFNGVKAGGTDVYKWTFEVDENGDLMPYVAAAA